MPRDLMRHRAPVVAVGVQRGQGVRCGAVGGGCAVQCRGVWGVVVVPSPTGPEGRGRGSPPLGIVSWLVSMP